MTSKIHCPQCKSGRFRSSQVRAVPEKLLRILLVRPYRCRDCGFRFYASALWTAPARSESKNTSQPKTQS